MGIIKGSRTLLLGALFLAVAIPYLSHMCPLLAKSTPVINITTGQIQGRVGYSLRSGKEYWQFLSIPYAEAPLGARRFQPAVPVQPWEGVKQVVKYPPYCVQYDALVLQVVQGVEDCLFVNVFVSNPRKEQLSSRKSEVIVFIHGGGYLSSGSRTYHPDFFMSFDDIVVVTFNYRLGPFGFLNLASQQETRDTNMRLPRGNMGLKDQTLVLRWIQSNIGALGGDNSKITLMGESAGAASVHLHMLSPQSQGLFHKGIALSGSAFNPWALSTDVNRVSRQFSRALGCPLEDKNKLMECLQSADAGKMVQLQKVLQEPTLENDMLVPSVELVQTEDTFLAEHPLDIFTKGGGAKIPFILGVNSGEGGLITARFDAVPSIVQKLDKIWRAKLISFASASEDTMTPSVAKKIRCYYFGSNASFSSLTPSAFQESLSRLSSDFLFFIPVHKAALQHARSGAPTYLYHFDYQATMLPSTYSGFRALTPNDWLVPSWIKVISTMIFDWIVEHTLGSTQGPRRFGVSHAEDLYQTWNLEGLTGYFTLGDTYFSNGLVETFVQFSRNKNDSSPLSFQGVEWPPLSNADVAATHSDYKPLPCMLMDNSHQPKMVLEPYRDRLQFWKSLGI